MQICGSSNINKVASKGNVKTVTSTGSKYRKIPAFHKLSTLLIHIGQIVQSANQNILFSALEQMIKYLPIASYQISQLHLPVDHLFAKKSTFLVMISLIIT